MYLSGQWRDSEAASFLPNINPAHKSEVLGYVPEATDAEVDQAMRAADAAFPAWRAVSGNMKTKIFLHLAQIMYARFEDFQQTMAREMGKTLFDNKLDLDEAIGVVECVAPQGLSLKGETYQKNIDGVVMESRLEPRGVAAIITPFNFPVAIPIAQIVAALVVGNTVVWKPSHLIPESSQAIAAAVRRMLRLGQRESRRYGPVPARSPWSAATCLRGRPLSRTRSSSACRLRGQRPSATPWTARQAASVSG